MPTKTKAVADERLAERARIKSELAKFDELRDEYDSLLALRATNEAKRDQAVNSHAAACSELRQKISDRAQLAGELATANRALEDKIRECDSIEKQIQDELKPLGDQLAQKPVVESKLTRAPLANQQWADELWILQDRLEPIARQRIRAAKDQVDFARQQLEVNESKGFATAGAADKLRRWTAELEAAQAEQRRIQDEADALSRKIREE